MMRRRMVEIFPALRDVPLTHVDRQAGADLSTSCRTGKRRRRCLCLRVRRPRRLGGELSAKRQARCWPASGRRVSLPRSSTIGIPLFPTKLYLPIVSQWFRFLDRVS